MRSVSSCRRPRSRSEVREQRADFTLRILVLLFDRELQGGLQGDARPAQASELQQRFAATDLRHHPIGFLRRTVFVVGERFGMQAVVREGLREAEAEEFVFRLLGDEPVKLFGARGHAAFERVAPADIAPGVTKDTVIWR